MVRLKEVPCGIEVAAHRFAAVVNKDGFEAGSIHVRDCNIMCLSLLDKDKHWHHMELINGEWFEKEER